MYQQSNIIVRVASQYVSSHMLPEMVRDGGAYRSMALEMARDLLEKPDPGAGEEEKEGREEEKGMAAAGGAGAGRQRRAAQGRRWRAAQGRDRCGR